MEELEGRVAVVTGAGAGIGEGIVRALVEAGMRVVATDVEADRVEQLASELGPAVTGRALDVTDRAAFEALAEWMDEAHGGADLLCNNAGVCIGGSLQTASDSDWHWLLSVNLEGVVNGLQAFVPRMVARGRGHVVNTASMGGHLAGPGLGIYQTTKFAVVGLSESLRGDLAETGVSASVLCPGFVRTELLSAERNRPADQAGSAPRLEFLKEGVESGIAPIAVGRLVVKGVREDAQYIFTHKEFRPVVEARMQGLLQAFDTID